MSELMSAAVNAPLLVAEQKLAKAEEQLRQAETRILDLHQKNSQLKCDLMVSDEIRRVLKTCKILAEGEVLRLREALTWYEKHARGCRLIHSEGDASRFELQHDGGSIARAALTQEGKA